jgi:hypothetical protein
MQKRAAAPRDWIGAKQGKWALIESLVDDNGVLPQFDCDAVNPLLPRDLRDTYRLVGQLGAPAIRVSRDAGGRLYVWRPDVERWRAWQKDARDGVVETGRIW